MADRIEDRGADNELRLRRRLWSDPAALRATRDLGLSDATIRRFRLGLKEPYVARSSGLVTERALAFPVLAADGTRGSRWSYLNLDGVTRHPVHPVSWGPGEPRSCYSRPSVGSATLLVVATAIDMWLVSQILGDAYGSIVVVCPSHPGGAPREWADPRFWRDWHDVVLGLSTRADEEDLATVVGRAADRGLRRCVMPADEGWGDLVRMGGSAAEVRGLVTSASPWRIAPVVPAHTWTDEPGDYEANPVAIEGAIIGGLMHYPVTLERRHRDALGAVGVGLVQNYVTRVLRSDGEMLDVERLRAPRGTRASDRVIALSDGTRIASAPTPNGFSSWRFGSIARFVEARSAGLEPSHRPPARLLADLEAYLRSSVWLPHPEDYLLVAAFVLATFVHRAFDAFPILLLNGAKGTGKSELGRAIAEVSCNAVVAGRISPAGLVRLLAESRGTVVLDDLEGIGTGRIGEEIAQILKTSYKASTARRVVPGRSGRVEVVDYYSPKVVSNIGGADPVLLSRMLTVETAPMPRDHVRASSLLDLPALRDEIHVWAMCGAAMVANVYRPLAAAAGDRRAEIAAPLRAVAALAGDAEVVRRLEAALGRTPDEPAAPIEALLAGAMRELVVHGGATEVAMPHLQLELALANEGRRSLPSAETLGRLMLTIGARSANGPVQRRRLHGEVVRVYVLSPRYLASVGVADSGVSEPFSFCARPCAGCRYENVCGETMPLLRAAKMARAAPLI